VAEIFVPFDDDVLPLVMPIIEDPHGDSRAAAGSIIAFGDRLRRTNDFAKYCAVFFVATLSGGSFRRGKKSRRYATHCGPVTRTSRARSDKKSEKNRGV
jgi:hypothetical protein